MEPAPHGQEEPIINITGELVALGPPRRDHLSVYQRWFNDFATMYTQGAPGPGPRTLEEMTPWYENHMTGAPEIHWFSVYEVTSWRLVGFAELKDIDFRNRTAELTLMIGEPECRDKGYGTETVRLMLDYGFTLLELHNIMLTVFSHNERGLRVYQRAGFREIGRRREACRSGGRAYDVIYMDCLATEFRSPALHRLLPLPPSS